MPVRRASEQAASRTPPRAVFARDQLRLAAELLRQGRRVEAEAHYRQVLLYEPANAQALHALAFLTMEAGELERAREYSERAVAAAPDNARLRVALGRVLRAHGDNSGAIRCYEQALRMDPRLADGWLLLGVALRAGDAEAALQCYRRAQELEPRNAGAFINMANILLDLGRDAEAEEILNDAVARVPDSADAHSHLGKLHKVAGRHEAARASFRRALECNPMLAAAALHLGELERDEGRLREACELLRIAAAADRGSYAAHLLLADALRELDSFDDAMHMYRRCIEIDPQQKVAYNNLAVVLQLGGRISEADEQIDKALAIDPEYLDARLTKATGLALAGDADQAFAICRAVLETQPRPYVAFASCFMHSLYVDSVSDQLRAEWLRGFAETFRQLPLPSHVNSRHPDRRLRVGYVSSDFRHHSVSFFIEPVLGQHDRGAFSVYCYFAGARADQVTDRLRSRADHWRECHGLDDARLAELIRRDEIDILVELGGHTMGSRLLALVHKPAPVQVTYLGYPTATGLPAIDYRLSDWQVDPPGEPTSTGEAPVRLPHSYYCYRPLEPSPDLTALPAKTTGSITFGSFNNLAKTGPVVIELWARILKRVAGSRLLLKAKSLEDAGVRDRTLERLARAGVPEDRVALRGWAREAGGGLALYQEMDIALDTYPYNGATTTCEALWMGVPVITLRGHTHASRMGASLLTACGLADLVARTPEDYVEIAVALAQDCNRLGELRAGMRERLRASPLMDETGFTRDVEEAYRMMWRNWCAHFREEAPRAVDDRDE